MDISIKKHKKRDTLPVRRRVPLICSYSVIPGSPSGFVHAKVFTSDDEKAVVGTVNMDYRSFYHHFEDGVLFYRGDDIIVIDPTLEYFDIAQNLGGVCINLSNYTQNYINPLWLDVDELDLADSKGLIRGEMLVWIKELL